MTPADPEEAEPTASPPANRASAQHAAVKRPQDAARNVITGQHPRITTSAQHERLTTSGQHERLTASGQHERLTASGQHERVSKSRVELVTRQTDDGSYELVYEEVSGDEEIDEGMPLTAGDLDPFWRRKPMVAVAILVGVVLVGGLSVAGVAALLDREPKKIAATDEEPTSGAEKPREQYEYVPPPNAGKQLPDPEENGDGDEDGEKKAVEAKASATVAQPGTPTRDTEAVGNRALPSAITPGPGLPKPNLTERPDFRDGLKAPVIPTPDKERLREALNERLNENQDDEEVIEESEEIPEEALEEAEEEIDEEGEEAPPEDEELDEENPDGDGPEEELPEGEGEDGEGNPDEEPPPEGEEGEFED
ncbi:MAG: hypothetical protein CMH57_10250 [Myxococcales bacterium]|nr:hypothetical protein [Myxococcales bacterium]